MFVWSEMSKNISVKVCVKNWRNELKDNFFVSKGVSHFRFILAENLAGNCTICVL
jgi:hypothetical protein